MLKKHADEFLSFTAEQDNRFQFQILHRTPGVYKLTLTVWFKNILLARIDPLLLNKGNALLAALPIILLRFNQLIYLCEHVGFVFLLKPFPRRKMRITSKFLCSHSNREQAYCQGKLEQ